VGSQILSTNIPSWKGTFILIVDVGEDSPPRRLGYYWMEVFVAAQPQLRYIIDSGVVFAPGFRRVMPFLGLNGGDYLRWWIDWNEAGLAWQTIVGDFP
jgi:hypothetical protein